MTSFAVRAIAAADLEEIVALHLGSFPVQSTPRFLARAYYPSFLAPDSTGFGNVAVVDGHVAGFCMAAFDDAALHRALLRRHPLECLLAAIGKLARRLRLVRRPVTRAVPRIHYLAVGPGTRGLGVGSRLTRLALEHMRATGHKFCWTSIARDNTGSIALHERLGFEVDTEWTQPQSAFQEYRCELAKLADSAS